MTTPFVTAISSANQVRAHGDGMGYSKSAVGITACTCAGGEPTRGIRRVNARTASDGITNASCVTRLRVRPRMQRIDSDPYCGFCRKNRPITRVWRLEIRDLAPRGYVEIRVPYCGEC